MKKKVNKRAYFIDKSIHGFSILFSAIPFAWRRMILKMRSEHVGRGVIINSGGIFIHTAKLRVGNNVSFGRRSFVSAKGGLTIGDNVLIAFDCVILTEKHIYGKDVVMWDSGFIIAPVRIGNNVLIGTKATIMPGVTIGDNVVIGAHSVVTKDIPSNTVAAGVPAKVIKKIK